MIVILVVLPVISSICHIILYNKESLSFALSYCYLYRELFNYSLLKHTTWLLCPYLTSTHAKRKSTSLQFKRSNCMFKTFPSWGNCTFISQISTVLYIKDRHLYFSSHICQLDSAFICTNYIILVKREKKVYPLGN